MAPCFWLKTDYMFSIKDLCVFPCCHGNAVQHGIIAAPPARANQGEGSTPQHFRVKKRQGAFKTKYVLFFYMPISVSDILGGMYAYT